MKWIKISDKLPPKDETVILAVKEGITVGWLDSMPEENNLFYSCEISDWLPTPVLYWAKLPKKPLRERILSIFQW